MLFKLWIQSKLLPSLYCFLLFLKFSISLREFRYNSSRSQCQIAQDPHYPYAYSKYSGQLFESKGRVNSNLQDFRHQCFVLGGRSKCNICEDIICSSEGGKCYLQLQGVDRNAMSFNIPTVSDTAWAVGGSYKRDFGGSGVSHFCVFTSGGSCILPETTDFSQCETRCFGYGFQKPAVRQIASSRSRVDVYPGMGRWPDDGQVDLWAYPNNCTQLFTQTGVSCSYSGPVAKIPDFNPQGYTFTVAGVGAVGFSDGSSTIATFNGPEDVAVDENGIVYVADTQNNAIRMIDTFGNVKTLAGKGAKISGFADGPCSQATFKLPKGLDVRHEIIKNVVTTVILVADTGNHRIRRIDYVDSTKACTVKCLTGLCGNNSLSASDFKFKATPLTGYADGLGSEARFSAPESVTFMDGNYFVIADTGNFLLRWAFVNNGTTFTLAGTVVPGQKDSNGNPQPGCTPPCMDGQPGFRDGNLSFAQFYNPLDVTRGPNNTVWVADEQRIRMVELPYVMTNIYGIKSTARVSTIAGVSLQGHDDGFGDESKFFYSSGVFVTMDSVAYVVDAASCRVRRISPLPSVAQLIQCSTIATSIIRPSGCTSFDQPIDKIGRKVSRVEANVQYNYDFPYLTDLDRGKYIKNCVGVPPRDNLDKHFISQGDNLVIDDYRTTINEDSEQGTAIVVTCPSSCQLTGSISGNQWYSENSNICMAAIHAGKISASGGIVQIVLQRRDFLNPNSSFNLGTTQHGITSSNIPSTVSRVFSIKRYNISNVMVHTIAGNPSAPLESACGFNDAQPPSLARFNNPSGISASHYSSLSNSQYIFIADTSNNRIRAISAVCTQICENGGTCVGNDVCHCPVGWSGIDCTKPICTAGLCNKPNFVCVAPNTCKCKPGYQGANCDQPQCVQKCLNGGSCTAPDSCTCQSGWFDPNCATPVCSQTCANGGNCTAPNTCACPTDWQGVDCRIPVCQQTCKNNGICIAPNTCSCPPQWSNYDCSAPVCDQGYFVRNQGQNSGRAASVFSIQLVSVATYKNCDLQSWCNATKEFECDQLQMTQKTIRVPSGPFYRHITGRKVPPKACMNIELPTSYKIPYQLLLSDNTTTGFRRFSPNSPYSSNNANPWRGYLNPTNGHTGPWVYTPDRQVLNVNWLNVSQGLYVCANGGSCVSPGVCACAQGWAGFDCRTPICSQGYYYPEQKTYVSGLETVDEIQIFSKFLGNNSYRLNWPYSNPSYSMEFEYYSSVSTGVVQRTTNNFPGTRYQGSVNINNGVATPTYQGGFRCSIRANTKWENVSYILNHPNYYSRYMESKRQSDNITYTFWKSSNWPPTHSHSRILDQYSSKFNGSFAFTNEGYRRRGIWNITGVKWLHGVCVMEFSRNCTDHNKELDLHSGRLHVYVQDTDLAYRPIVRYDDFRVYAKGRWKEAGGQCVDQVVRGCYNNGTCIAPNVCRCAQNWTGIDCTTPICAQTCHHNGNCTGPNQCTCEKGWSGYDCLIPICAQECNNGGKCIAPDTCKCLQWPNSFRDGRIAGGRPLYQDETGDPLPSGWTGYDCATPICVQASSFLLNVKSRSSKGFVAMGGHGADNLLTCTDPNTGLDQPRCPQFDPNTDPFLKNVYITGNDGKSFQTGCGFDPYDTGCCVRSGATAVTCYACAGSIVQKTNNTFFCSGSYTSLSGVVSETDKFKAFLDDLKNFILCGKYHAPRDYLVVGRGADSGQAKYFKNVLIPRYSSFNFRSNWTSNRFLCNVDQWIQGDYIDDAGYGDISGVGSIYGLDKKRHVRINYPNIIVDQITQTFKRGPKIRGEGVYRCQNNGSCLAPDICTCQDGFTGYDCSQPLCRHLQPSGKVTSCLNGGFCTNKDLCSCVQTGSVLWNVHPDASRGITGWTGSDCTMPICVQGFYDPFCTDLPQAPGGEGCFRCANRGNCTAPDVCTCAPGWTGFDCNTPVCEVFADPLTRTQLPTISEDKVLSFETDPCAMMEIFGLHGWKGKKYARGNCTQPNQCTCLCRIPYNQKSCHKTGKLCDGPWQDNLVATRNLLVNRGVEYIYGTADCAFGYEGNIDSLDRFTTCHLTIYTPSSGEKSSLTTIIIFIVILFIVIVGYRYISVRVRRRFLLAKIERRRSKRSSEESLLSAGSGAFNTK